MTVEAKVIEDSISPDGVRLTTMQIRLHRFVLAEFNTHRVFSRSFSSSRAIPVKKLLEQVRNFPAVPVQWSKNQPGMQANEELTGDSLELAKDAWRKAAHAAADYAEVLAQSGAHKSLANRVIEPFLYVSGVVTSTEWNNFYSLRCHADAQPEIQELAVKMRAAQESSVPVLLQPGEWHLPYLRAEERNSLDVELARMYSAARCARVSYLKHDSTVPSVDDDVELFNKLAGSNPKHLSPTEHQATPQDECFWDGNFRGWYQFRQDVE